MRMSRGRARLPAAGCLFTCARTHLCVVGDDEDVHFGEQRGEDGQHVRGLEQTEQQRHLPALHRRNLLAKRMRMRMRLLRTLLRGRWRGRGRGGDQERRAGQHEWREDDRRFKFKNREHICSFVIVLVLLVRMAVAVAVFVLDVSEAHENRLSVFVAAEIKRRLMLLLFCVALALAPRAALARALRKRMAVTSVFRVSSFLCRLH